MNFLSLFAGIGGIDLGLERAGMRCVAQVEINPFARDVLAKHWPDVPKFPDVRTFTKDCVNERVDCIAGGFPCQDISNAGHKVGLDGARSGLWSEYRRIVRELRPRYVIVENVAALLNRGIDRVLGDLATLGFDAEWSVLSACAMGAPHTRERLFIVAYAASGRRFGASTPQARWRSPFDGQAEPEQAFQAGGCAGLDGGGWWVREPTVARMVDGTAAKMDGPNRALGNAVVPQIAEWIGRRLILDSTLDSKPSPATPSQPPLPPASDPENATTPTNAARTVVAGIGNIERREADSVYANGSGGNELGATGGENAGGLDSNPDSKAPAFRPSPPPAQQRKAAQHG